MSGSVIRMISGETCCFSFCVILAVGLVIHHAFCDDILGCGGFAKSDIDIDFSQVEVKLYTKQGSLKDHTECAPNNGYYFLPVYDTGEYVLKIQPPAGWSFEPREVNVNVDGVNDVCSKQKDINFHFKGFAIVGKVASVGSNIGPKGVKVVLLPEGKEDPIIHETFTAEDGSFLFTPVPPGRYIVRASHSKWQLVKSSAPVVLSKGNADIGVGSLLVAGYDVSGSVTSDDEPIKGVSFILFQSEGAPVNIKGCDKKPIPGFVSADTPLCHVTSDERGQFVFPVVPPGHYRVVPHYAGPQNIKFDVKPTQLPFTVGHSSLQINTQFQVKGFSVGGRVLRRAGGRGVSGATVLLDGKVQTKTREDGSYHLENMQAGSYTLMIQANDMKFAESVVKVTPNTPQLAPVFPVAFKVCGSVAPHQLPLAQPDTSPRNVLLTRVGGSAQPQVVETGRGNREFCHFLEPGQYEASVEVTEPEKKRGLVFSPLVHTFEVVDGPLLTGIQFTQLRVDLSGKVLCRPEANCDALSVILHSVSAPEIRHPLTSALTHGGDYIFTSILPGQYEVLVDKEDWCWEQSKHIVTVGTTTSKWSVPAFKHSGYALSIVSSHNTQSWKRLTVPEGSSKSCVIHSGEYEIVPVGCHGYSDKQMRYSLSSTPLKLTAIAHTLSGVIESHENVADLTVQMLRDGNKQIAKLGPLKAEPLSGGKFAYKFSLMATDGEALTFVPSASALLFTPPRLNLVGPSDCTERAVVFNADRGHVVEGKFIPALQGVKVLVRRKGSEEVIVAAETADDGKYKFDPLPGGVEYEVIAEKDGYVFSGPDSKNIMQAHKLAEIVVEILDKANSKPLQGVLLSLSGGESFRQNSQTGADGKRTFSYLSPGEYYLRPMLKEYRFEPNSKMITVEEGATVNVQLQGLQVAFSAYGMVTSLNGEPQSGVVVEAVGEGPCQQYQEESSTEANGQFRIRGLHPQCDYTVRVKQGHAVNEHIERSTPVGIQVKATEGDVTNLRLIVFHAWTQMDVALLVETSSADHLRTLKAKLCREDSPDSPLHIIKLDSYAGSPPARPSHTCMVMFPQIPLDGHGYFVQLESSLSRATHTYTTHAVHFRANHTFKQLRIAFRPEPRVMDQELNHSSYFALPLLIVCVLLWMNHQKVMPFLSKLAQVISPPPGGISGRSGGTTHRDTHVTSAAEAAADAVMVEPVLNVRSRKSKSRKT
ncbi:Nodal modulator 1 [Gryllus bimaculatus]|nr:Nodal modulator 1 [Gryllus bimaculatus]